MELPIQFTRSLRTLAVRSHCGLFDVFIWVRSSFSGRKAWISSEGQLQRYRARDAGKGRLFASSKRERGVVDDVIVGCLASGTFWSSQCGYQ